MTLASVKLIVSLAIATLQSLSVNAGANPLDLKPDRNGSGENISSLERKGGWIPIEALIPPEAQPDAVCIRCIVTDNNWFTSAVTVMLSPGNQDWSIVAVLNATGRVGYSRITHHLDERFKKLHSIAALIKKGEVADFGKTAPSNNKLLDPKQAPELTMLLQMADNKDAIQREIRFSQLETRELRWLQEWCMEAGLGIPLPDSHPFFGLTTILWGNSSTAPAKKIK